MHVGTDTCASAGESAESQAEHANTTGPPHIHDLQAPTTLGRGWRGRGRGRRHLFESELTRAASQSVNVRDPLATDAPTETLPADRIGVISHNPSSRREPFSGDLPLTREVLVRHSYAESSSSHEAWHATEIEAGPLLREPQLPPDARQAPILMTVTHTYDGHEFCASGSVENGYMAVTAGENVYVISTNPAEGHQQNRFRSYLYAYSPSSPARGWLSASFVTECVMV